MVSIIGTLVLAACSSSAGTWSQAGQPAPKVRNVAIVVHRGVELLDFAGPAEVFSMNGDAFHVYTVAPSAGTVMSQANVSVNPEYTIENCPRPDILVIPGGDTDVLTSDPTMMAWIKKTAAESEITMTVCTGAFTLAENGMLDGLTATTYWGAIDSLRKTVPTATVVTDQRFVDNGKIVTTAGISAGIDGALHVVDRLLGHEEAWRAARGMQYLWEPPADLKGAEREALRAWTFRDWGAALEAYGAIIKEHPDNVEAHRRLATALMNTDRAGEAVEVLKKARAMAPTDGGIASTLGRAYLFLKQPVRAAECYGKAIELGTRDSTTLYNAACASALAGDKDTAFERLEQSLDAGLWGRRLFETDTDLDSLRGDPRFGALMKRLG